MNTHRDESESARLNKAINETELGKEGRWIEIRLAFSPTGAQYCGRGIILLLRKLPNLEKGTIQRYGINRIQITSHCGRISIRLGQRK